jgi:HD-like signal output (HDOD) protein
MERPDWKVADLARVVEADAGVAARTLRLANSSFYGSPREVGTVGEAISLVGTEELRSLVLATTVLESFRGVPAELVSMRDFLSASVRCAATCARLATRAGPPVERGRLFISGLLHDVGSLVVCMLLPEATRAALLHGVRGPCEDGVSIEREVMQSEDAPVGAALLDHWRLPESVVAAVRWHPSPEQAERYRTEAALVGLGSRLALGLARGIHNLTDQVPAESALWRQGGVTPEELAGLADEVEADYAATMSLFPAN